MNERRRALAARREHSKGDGNFPDVEPGAVTDERPEDRTPGDLPKGRDPRSAPKGNVAAGQQDRNPELEVRDDHRAVLPRPETGYERAVGEAGDADAEDARPRR